MSLRAALLSATLFAAPAFAQDQDTSAFPTNDEIAAMSADEARLALSKFLCTQSLAVNVEELAYESALSRKLLIAAHQDADRYLENFQEIAELPTPESFASIAARLQFDLVTERPREACDRKYLFSGGNALTTEEGIQKILYEAVTEGEDVTVYNHPIINAVSEDILAKAGVSKDPIYVSTVNYKILKTAQDLGSQAESAPDFLLPPLDH